MRKPLSRLKTSIAQRFPAVVRAKRALSRIVRILTKQKDPVAEQRLSENRDAAAQLKQDFANRDCYDVLITTGAICDDHGTGIFVKRIFTDHDGLVSIRSRDLYASHDNIAVANFVLHDRFQSYKVIESHVEQWLAGAPIRSIICIPYINADLALAEAAHRLTGAPVCHYVMDDSNIYAREISDSMWHRACQLPGIRLAISNEMAKAYSTKYKVPFWVVPPLVSPDLILDRARTPAWNGHAPNGILIGNIWDRLWLRDLMRVLDDADIMVDWYYSTGAWQHLNIDPNDISDSHLQIKECADGSGLVDLDVVREAPFVLVPTSRGNHRIGRLSLPSRTTFVAACANTPIIVLGSEDNAVSQFVLHNDIGRVVPYNGAELRNAVESVLQKGEQMRLRRNAASIARSLSAEGLADWLVNSTCKGRPADDRYRRPLKAA